MCGDFNINLINSGTETNTAQFLDLIYSYGLQPLITKPNRVTESTKNLIDNVFTSEINANIQPGLLIHDITDHLPVFVLLLSPSGAAVV